jgi:hypothetical protein
VFIYALADPRTFSIRYVGKSTNPTRRFRQHLADKTDSYKSRWVWSLAKLGLSPVLVVLEKVRGDWQERERFWIRLLSTTGNRLTNLTSGGEGLHDPSDSTRQKIGRIRREQWQDEKQREKLMAVIRSPGRRAAISVALKGKRKTAEHVAKLPQNQIGSTRSAEQRKKISAALMGNTYRRGKKASPETRERIAAASRGRKYPNRRPWTEAERLARSITQKGKPKSEEHKEKLRQAALRRWRNYREGARDDQRVHAVPEEPANHSAERTAS